MNLFDGIILGIVQGLTEFLPVSSTGHLDLILLLLYLGEENTRSLVIFLHLSTVLAVLFYFRRDIAEILRALFIRKIAKEQPGTIHLIKMIILGLCSTAVVYFVFKNILDRFLEKPQSSQIGIAFFFTAVVLIAIAFRKEGPLSEEGIKPWHAILIGVAQGIGIIPGVSRSGMTICMALLIGLSAPKAFRFSFLLSIPTIIAAWIYDVISNPNALSEIGRWDALLLGSIAAFFTALLAIYLLKGVVVKHKLWIFAIYLIPAGLFAVLYTFGG